MLEPSLRTLCQDLNKFILVPRLERQAGGDVRAIHIDGNDIWTSQDLTGDSLCTLFSDIRLVIDFLRTRLPPSVVASLSGILMPNLISRVISIWLSSAVPMDLDGMQEFQGTIDLILQFAEDLKTYQWPGTEDLVAWTKGVPRVWLEKRRGNSLDSIRKLLTKGLGPIRTVERVETQALSREDDVLAGGGGKDDWNAEWSDEEAKISPKPVADHGGDNGEEEDVSAWGLDDDTHDENAQEAAMPTDAGNDDTDAWGWEDEGDTVQSSGSAQPAPGGPGRSRTNGHPDAPSHAKREVTLKETYNITSLPSEVLDIIAQVLSDAEKLANPKCAVPELT